MIEAAGKWLTQQMLACTGQENIWCCDENLLDVFTDAQGWALKLFFVSNRWDIAEEARKMGFQAEFNDFNLSHYKTNSMDNFFYRISKEKAVTHHIINQAFRILKPQGRLWLCGEKNEGIKTYVEKASNVLGCENNIQKNGASYSSQLTKKILESSLLNDDDYSTLRPSLHHQEKTIYTKPGQFGWNKIDQGSEFLVSQLMHLLELNNTRFEHCLDLGCGYGFLTLATLSLNINQRVLTDNNAAALLSAKHNCEALGVNAEVVASDAGQQLNTTFDLILCNPPFHQGFSVDGDLTDKFLTNTKHLLSKKGIAYFVVNQFIPLEKKAMSHFKSVKLIARNKSFKVLELRLT
jgi:16S rRNA (guanine1207-N2)-methyltransferase